MRTKGAQLPSGRTLVTGLQLDTLLCLKNTPNGSWAVRCTLQMCSMMDAQDTYMPLAYYKGGCNIRHGSTRFFPESLRRIFDLISSPNHSK